MRALFSGDPERIREAQRFQRESFKARYGVDLADVLRGAHDESADDPDKREH